MNQIKENIMRIVFTLCALVSIAAVVIICLFMFVNAFPAFKEIGVLNFLGGRVWKPLEGSFGIFPMIVGSIYVTAGAIIIGVPIAIFCAVFLSCFCPAWLYKIIKPMTELLAGIPSIVYGFFGLTVIVPAMQKLTGTSGKGIVTASLMLGIMILPTVIGVAESAIRAVPDHITKVLSHLCDKRAKRVFCKASGGEIGTVCRRYTRYRPCNRRDHGGCYDSRKSGGTAGENYRRYTYTYFKYRS